MRTLVVLMFLFAAASAGLTLAVYRSFDVWEQLLRDRIREQEKRIDNLVEAMRRLERKCENSCKRGDGESVQV